MELREALGQIDAIRAQVARTETFRGYRPATVALTGVLGLVAAVAQSSLIPSPADNPMAFVDYWLVVAVVSLLLNGSELAINWYKSESPLARQQTRRAIEQFLPSLVAGGVLTLVFWKAVPDALNLLPGLWAIVFSLGIFASARQLPSAIRGVGVYYLAAGIVCLGFAEGDLAFSPWAMGLTFGVGQLLSAAVLYLTLEKRHGEA